MVIESVRVQHYRSILDETLHCDALTVLVGANGTGKSAFLRALDLFYSSAPKVEPDDFYDGDASKEIVVAVAFGGLSDLERKQFGPYVRDNALAVERVVRWNDGKPTYKLHGWSLRCALFRPVREALAVKDRGKTAREAYESIKGRAEFATLQDWPGVSLVTEVLNQWESANADKCDPARDDGQFFGFTEVGQGYLGKDTRFLLVPAVRDAATDAAEGRGSVLTTLMDLVVRSVLAKSEALKHLRETTQQQYSEMVGPGKLAELDTLAGTLTSTLRTFVPDAGVDLRWLPAGDIDIPMPKADVKLVEDGYHSTVTRTGHGLQRAFVLTLLQHLTAARIPTDEPAEAAPERQLPGLVLAIEEPELYQHPSRQRHMAKVLNELASGRIPGVADHTQIIYCTHSPLLVGIDRINQVRLLRKHEVQSDKPKVTKVVRTTLDRVAAEVWKADGSKGDTYTGATILPRLRSIMTPWMNEGFFADVVVLVEGEDDRAAVLGVARSMNQDLESMGLAVIPCGGKKSLDRPAIIFRQLGIPVYLVWDGDCGKGATSGRCPQCNKPLDKKPDPADNRRLLRLLDMKEEDWPQYVEPSSACFEKDLEGTLCAEVGQAVFEELLAVVQEEYAIEERQHALKNPAVIDAVVRKAKERGASSVTLENIVKQIVSLLPSHADSLKAATVTAKEMQ